MRNHFNDVSGLTFGQTTAAFLTGAIPAVGVGIGAGFLTKLIVVAGADLAFGAGVAAFLGGASVLIPALVGGAIGAGAAGFFLGRHGFNAGALGGLFGAAALTYLTVSGIAGSPDMQNPRITQTSASNTTVSDIAPVVKAPLPAGLRIG